MVRTQIFLTEKENRLLAILAKKQRTTRSEIIRDALDARLGISQTESTLEALSGAWGCLKGRLLKKQLLQQRAQW
jgi:metal-responsive CopG/Arc/MetJ family transcriptional regulator